MAATEYARGLNITVDPIPIEMTYFSLAKEFKWLPDEIDRQEPKKLKGIMHVLSIYNDTKNQETNRAGSKKPSFRGGGSGKQYVDITNPETERQLQQGTLKI